MNSPGLIFFFFVCLWGEKERRVILSLSPHNKISKRAKSLLLEMCSVDETYPFILYCCILEP